MNNWIHDQLLDDSPNNNWGHSSIEYRAWNNLITQVNWEGVCLVCSIQPESEIYPIGTNFKLLRYDLNTLRTGDADLRFYVTTVQDGWRRFAFLTR